MADNKTKATEASVEEYIASRASEQQAADCKQLMAMMKKITKKSPKMWGPSIVGYDSYRYTYDSGRTGEAPLTGFAIRGRELTVYLDCDSTSRQALLARLGKHKMTKSCLYIKQLADIDLKVLEELVTDSIKAVRARYS
jgi:hypothetical protein